LVRRSLRLRGFGRGLRGLARQGFSSFMIHNGYCIAQIVLAVTL
jgi:hypothetical protein